ncbi:formylglycine-generating enzyme family protein [Spirulina subsalsa]|uniref:formylglycine-generating enzyme family protein n=1 Tax=Spirulina subsalsa TaxID=54311 RepID=UPI0003051729|nr:formylglycine-generating enzyme family protein [Spirulina subsalsa]
MSSFSEQTETIEIVQVDAFGTICDRLTPQHTYWVEPLNAKVALLLSPIPSGTFLMGTPQTELGWTPVQSPQHSVTLAPFALSKYPITQAQWRVVATFPQVERPLVTHPACFEGRNRPVEQITWWEALEFCARLSQHTGRNYRLPSEAEWEYACRAGTTTPFCFGETITTQLANYSGIDWDYGGKICSYGAYGQGPQGADLRETTVVGHYCVANAFGLYDMHGLVREWCADVWYPNYNEAPPDGQARRTGGEEDKRVVRGGSWNKSPVHCRSGARLKFNAQASLYDVGFRVCLTF